MPLDQYSVANFSNKNESIKAIKDFIYCTRVQKDSSSLTKIMIFQIQCTMYMRAYEKIPPSLLHKQALAFTTYQYKSIGSFLCGIASYFDGKLYVVASVFGSICI